MEPVQPATTAPRWKKWLRVHLWRHTVVLSLPVGIIAGLGAIAFSFLLEQTSRVALVQSAGYVMPQPGAEGGASRAQPPQRRWLLVLLPAIGGLLSGLLVYSLAPEAEGHGTDAVIESFHHRRGVIRKRVPIVKTLASVLTIGTGGSAGREGPIGQIGAGFGSALATWLKTSDRERRLLMLAGAGAGIGAVFRAPLGGALFICEVLYREMEFESGALVQAFVGSIVAYSLYCGVEGVWGPIFTVPPLQFNHPVELLWYLILGVLCAIVGVIHVKVFYGVRDRIFRPLRLPNHLKPALGGLAVGIIGWFMPEILGMGYGWTQLAIDGILPLQTALGLVAVKMAATGLTISSGGSGGVFAPSIVIGGCLGGAMGMLLHRIAPGLPIQPAAFVLVGMAGFFAGVAKAPISSLVMVSEMTLGYGLLVPLMLTAAVAYLLVPRSISIYEKQVESRADSPAHEGEFMTDVLGHIQVRDVLARDSKLVLFGRDAPLTQVLQAMVKTRQQVFPVVDEEGRLVGAIDFQDLRVFLTEPAVPSQFLIALDLAGESKFLTPDQDLSQALKRLQTVELEALPVVEDERSMQVIGVLSRRDIIEAYHDRMYRQEEALTHS